VVEAANAFVRVMVDCTGPDQELKASAATRPVMERYAVEAWPTVVFLAADGSELERFSSCRKPDHVLRSMARAQQRALGPLAWVRARARDLEDPDPEVRARAAAALARLRSEIDAALDGAQKDRVPVRAHATVETAGARVEFGCSSPDRLFFRFEAGRPARVVVENAAGRTLDVEPAPTGQFTDVALPDGFGPAVALRLVPVR